MVAPVARFAVQGRHFLPGRGYYPELPTGRTLKTSCIVNFSAIDPGGLLAHPAGAVASQIAAPHIQIPIAFDIEYSNPASLLGKLGQLTKTAKSDFLDDGKYQLRPWVKPNDPDFIRISDSIRDLKLRYLEIQAIDRYLKARPQIGDHLEFEDLGNPFEWSTTEELAYMVLLKSNFQIYLLRKNELGFGGVGESFYRYLERFDGEKFMEIRNLLLRFFNRFEESRRFHDPSYDELLRTLDSVPIYFPPERIKGRASRLEPAKQAALQKLQELWAMYGRMHCILYDMDRIKYEVAHLQRSTFDMPFQDVIAKIADGEEPVILGNYRIVRWLGGGMMGHVYQGVSDRNGQSVAIKVLKPEAMKNPGFVMRLRAEAQAGFQLDHPNIARVHKTDLLFSREGDTYDYVIYVVYDYVKGPTGRRLMDWLQQQGQLMDPLAALYWAYQIADAMHYAHTRHPGQEPLLHRDLKPHNMMIRPDFKALVIDWGFALRMPQAPTDRHHHRMTDSGVSVVGTSGYSPHELGLGKRGKVDGRTDVYSLAIILFEWITGSKKMLPLAAQYEESSDEDALDYVSEYINRGRWSDVKKRLDHFLSNDRRFDVAPVIRDKLSRLIMNALQLEMEKRTATMEVFKTRLLEVIHEYYQRRTGRELPSVDRDPQNWHQQITDTIRPGFQEYFEGRE